MAIIDNVVKNLKQGEGFNCGSDSVEFDIPSVGKVTLTDSDWGEEGFDVMTVESGGRVHRFESKKFPNQFKKIGDYIGKECSSERETVVHLGRKRERKVYPVEAPMAPYRAELPEIGEYENILAKARNMLKPMCQGTVECQTLVGSIELGIEYPLRRLLYNINLKLNSSYSGLSRADQKTYTDLVADIKGFLDRIDNWKYATDQTKVEPFLSWVSREYSK